MPNFRQLANSAIVNTLPRHSPALDAAILLGSTATGHARADSDVDIAVFGARIACKAILRRRVDLVDQRRASTVLQCQVLKDGRYLLGEMSPRAGTFELFVAHNYEDWQIKRRGLMHDIAERGAVYAW